MSRSEKEKHFLQTMKSMKQEKSVFDDTDEANNISELSELEKIYMGPPSKVKDINIRGEYCKKIQNSKEKRKKSKIFIDDFHVECDVLNEEIRDELVESSIPVKITAYSVLKDGAKINPDVEVEKEDEDDVKDRALRIAMDIAKAQKIISVGGTSYLYNGIFYTLINDQEVQRLIFMHYRREIGQGSAASVLRNAANLVPFCIEQKYEEFPVNSKIIVFTNGTLEVDTGIFRENSPKDLANSALGIKYKPDKRKMPYTKLFLETIANGDKDLYRLMLQVIGYILSNDIRAKSFFYLEGVGDAGKSRFCDLIASFFSISGKNKVARTALQDLGGKFALGNLVNAKLNISEDLPDAPLSPTTVSRIKMLSDGNRLEAEAKYVQAFSFRPTCKLLFASNHPLRLKEYDAAFVNRVVYIPFLNAIPKHKQDRYILEKMQGELSALFNHAFEAYQQLVADGYAWAGAERFKPRISIVNSNISYNRENVLRQFMNNCCVFKEDAIISTAEVQEAYNKFCNEKSFLPIVGDRFSREFMAVLPDTVTRVKIGNQKRGFKGIGLKESHIDEKSKYLRLN